MKNALYISSLLFLIIPIILIIQYPDTRRIYLIAGSCAFVGFVINILSFSMRTKQLR